MKNIILIIIIIILCNTNELFAQQKSAIQDIEILLNYFNCEECDNNELQNVVKLGKEAIPILTKTLNEGPSNVVLIDYQEHLKRSYDQMINYNKTHKDKMPYTEQKYIEVYTGNLINAYQIRSAIALVKIAGKDAKPILLNARPKIKNPAVLKKVEVLINELN